MLSDIINAPLDELLKEASRVRSETFGNEIELCAIVNIKSGSCKMDCRFCAQSKHHNTSVETFPILESWELDMETLAFYGLNIRQVGWVSSGHTATPSDVHKIIKGLQAIKSNPIWAEYPDICVSLGQLKTPELRQLRDAGFCRYHHNLETSERFYPSICTTQRWQDRRATVERVKELGWSVCSGGLFGLGETWEDRLQLALTLKELEVDSVPINFLSPIPGTPLAKREVLTPDEALRIVALFRLTLPKATIRICGGRPSVFAEREQDTLLFHAGANALMTGNYLTTSGISPEKDREMINRLKQPVGASKN